METQDDIPQRIDLAGEPPFGEPGQASLYREDYQPIDGNRYELQGRPGETISSYAWRKLKKRGDAPQKARKEAHSESHEPTEQGKPGLPWFKQARVLSKQEARELEEPLIAALQDDFGYIDQYVWYRTRDETQAPIWSDMADEEVATIARLWLKQGQRSAAAATMARAMVNGSDYLSALVILVPRTIKTLDRLKQAPKRERPPRRGDLRRMQQ